MAVTTAANMCRGLSQDSLKMVQEAVPMLTNLLQYQVRLECMPQSFLAVLFV